MKIVVSPAKSLDYESKLPTKKVTQPIFLQETEKINKSLSRKSKKELKGLMNISDKLADLNYERYKEFTLPFTESNARPAAFAFSGDVYIGLDAYSIPSKKMDALQDTLRILSGFYGVLKPLDLMQPYRLEMGTDLAINKSKNLYEFWGDKITEQLNKEIKEKELFLNLASKEYFRAINPKKLKVPVISPVFKDFKNGQLKIISFFAKKARGSMVRYIIDKDVKDIKGVLGFDYEGYHYSEEYTTKENEPVFIR